MTPATESITNQPPSVANIYNTGTLDTNYAMAAPVLTADSGSAAFTAADNGVSTPVAVDNGLTHSDSSASTLASAAVAITSNFRSAEDVLSFVNNASTMGNVGGSYDSGTGILTLSSSGATAKPWRSGNLPWKVSPTPIRP